MARTVFDQLTEEQLRQRKTIKWNLFGPDVLPLWIAEMDFPTAPAVLDGIRACVANEEFGYPPVGEDDLPKATADWCRRRYGWRVSPEWAKRPCNSGSLSCRYGRPEYPGRGSFFAACSG